VRVRGVVSALLLGWMASAHAIVDIEALRAGAPQPGYSGALNVSADGQSGNTEKVAINAGARLQWHGGAVTNFAILRYNYGATSGVQDTNKFFFHARHIHQISDRRAYEGFIQAERNIFARLDFRGLIGGGLRLTLTEIPDKKTLHFGAGGFFSREKLQERAGLTDAERSNIWRVNTYLNYVQQLNHSVRVLSTTYYQPAIEDFSDYRLLEEATLSVKMTDTLSLNVSLDLAHDSKPPQAVKKTDTTYSTGAEYSF